MSTEQVSTDQSVIHDIGYQRYAGVRLGRRYSFRALYEHSLRTAFGLGRGVLAKLFPWAAVALVGVFATTYTVVRVLTGEIVGSYAEFADGCWWVVFLFCAAVAPELVSRDLRTGVLPLYFSRPIERDDYPLAKLAALISGVWLMLAGAQALIFIGAAFSVDRVGAVWDELLDLLPGVAYSAVYAVVFASLSLLVASLVGRRAVAAGAVIAAFLVPGAVAGVLTQVGGETLRQLGGLAGPVTMVSGVGRWLLDVPGPGLGPFGPLYGVVTMALLFACVVGLLARYRRVAA